MSGTHLWNSGDSLYYWYNRDIFGVVYHVISNQIEFKVLRQPSGVQTIRIQQDDPLITRAGRNPQLVNVHPLAFYMSHGDSPPSLRHSAQYTGDISQNPFGQEAAAAPPLVPPAWEPPTVPAVPIVPDHYEVISQYLLDIYVYTFMTTVGVSHSIEHILSVLDSMGPYSPNQVIFAFQHARARIASESAETSTVVDQVHQASAIQHEFINHTFRPAVYPQQEGLPSTQRRRLVREMAFNNPVAKYIFDNIGDTYKEALLTPI